MSSIKKHIPNILTSLRVLFIPFIICLLWDDKLFESRFIQYALCLVLYALAAITDFFDGYLARKWNAHTAYGAFTDSLADKGLTLAVFFSFALMDSFFVPLWMILLIAIREIGLTVLRVYAMYKKTSLVTEKHGKIKTFFQMSTQVLFWLVLVYFGYHMDKSFVIDALPKGMHALDYIYSFIINMEGLQAMIAQSLNYLILLMVILSTYLTVSSGVTYIVKNKKLFKR